MSCGENMAQRPVQVGWSRQDCQVGNSLWQKWGNLGGANVVGVMGDISGKERIFSRG